MAGGEPLESQMKLYKQRVQERICHVFSQRRERAIHYLSAAAFTGLPLGSKQHTGYVDFGQTPGYMCASVGGIDSPSV